MARVRYGEKDSYSTFWSVPSTVPKKYARLCRTCRREFATNLAHRTLCARCTPARESWMKHEREDSYQAWAWKGLFR